MSLPMTIEPAARDDVRPLILDQGSAAPLPLVGGKAAHLARLEGSGLRVPPWLSVTTELFITLLEALPDELMARLAALDAKATASIATTSRDLQDAFLATEMPSAWRDAILEACDRAFGPEALVAVRSSAVGEDSVHSSQAGLMESHLFVPREAVPRRVQETLASAFSAPCLLYQLLRGNDPRRIRAAVVIQEMIDAQTSGVLFTVNPTTGDSGELVIAAGYGLGEGVVADLVETDTIHVERASGRITRQDVPAKARRVVRDPRPGGGTRIEELPQELREGAVLRAAQIAELADGGQRIEKLFGRAQDIEWAIDAAGRLFITQARPVTTRRRGRRRIFDNTNIVEGYPGVTTPLTFSYVRAAFELAFSKTAATYGASGALLQRLRPLSRNALGLIDGRIYYNILNWYRSFASLPGLGLFRASWEKAFGLSAEDRPNLAELGDGGGGAAWRQKLAAYRRLIRNFLLLEKDLARFHRQVATMSERFAAHDLESATADELFELYEEIMERLLGEWDVPHTNDIYAFLFSHILGKLLQGWGLDDKNRLFNGLLCGESGMESVAPVRSLVALAERVRQSELLSRLFAEEDDNRRLWQRLANDPACEGFHRRALRHLELYGHRTVQELKLETPPLSERPEDFIAMLRNVLHHPVTVEAMEEREGAIRREAERTVSEALRFRPLRRGILGYVLRQARTRIRTRENNRLIRTRVWGMVGQVFRALGRTFAEAGHLDAPEDIFYLGVEEIEGFIRGTAISRSLRSLVAVRRAEYEHYQTTEPARRITTEGIVYERPFSKDTTDNDDDGEPRAVLTGIGCSAGSVRGTARVVLDPAVDASIADQILIAPMTDPGWVFLMVAARGLVVERGGVLSHTAIIGRELGIPTVVGVEGATRRIRDGQEIEIDGEQGTVRILDA